MEVTGGLWGGGDWGMLDRIQNLELQILET